LGTAEKAVKKLTSRNVSNTTAVSGRCALLHKGTI